MHNNNKSLTVKERRAERGEESEGKLTEIVVLLTRSVFRELMPVLKCVRKGSLNGSEREGKERWRN